MAYLTSYRAAARQFESACDCCGQFHEAPESREPSLAQRWELRKLRGRPTLPPHTTTHEVTLANGRRARIPEYRLDPMLRLKSLRAAHRGVMFSGGGWPSMEYGRVLQEVVTPTLGALADAERELAGGRERAAWARIGWGVAA